MKIRARVVVLMTLVALFAWRGAAVADDPCDADAAKFCSGMKSADPNYAACMKQNLAKLSKPCQHEVQAAAARANDLKQFPACVADAEKLCPSGQPGTGHIVMCLRRHQADLSSGCKNEIRRRRGT